MSLNRDHHRGRRARRRMVARDLVARGLRDRRVLAVMAWVPRDRFVADEFTDQAYADTPLPIGAGQTISQPYIVALMTEWANLSRHSRVLEIGTGSGYHTAVIAKIARHVWSVERLPALTHAAARRLAALRITNVTLTTGDGAAGLPARAPYDAIIVAAAAARPPRAILEQLADGGRLIIPLGDRRYQDLAVLERAGDGYRRRNIGRCRFVPFVSGVATSPS